MFAQTKKYIKTAILDQAFHPTWCGVFVNPFYFARLGILKATKKYAPMMQGKLLDIGCGQKNYVSYYNNVEEYLGIEYDSPQNRLSKNADFFYDGKLLPFENSSFDCAVSNEVFEHVFNPQKHLQEIYRILKPEGLFFLTVPFVWDEHEQPHDFARYSSFGLISLLQKTGFEVIHAEKTSANASVLFQLINAYIYKITLRFRRTVISDILTTLLCNAPVTLIGIVISRILPKNPDLYLDNIIVAKKIC